MTIFGREQEQKILQRCLKSNKPELLVVYGRFRIGKTYLIREFFNHSFSFYTSGINNSSTRLQLKTFENALHSYGLHSSAPLKIGWMRLINSNFYWRKMMSIVNLIRGKELCFWMSFLGWMVNEVILRRPLICFETPMVRQNKICF